jgi:hypothetical protein
MGSVPFAQKRKVGMASKLRVFLAEARAPACDPVMSLLTVEAFDGLDPPLCKFDSRTSLSSTAARRQREGRGFANGSEARSRVVVPRVSQGPAPGKEPTAWRVVEAAQADTERRQCCANGCMSLVR